jgi:uncharacterized membrane protein
VAVDELSARTVVYLPPEPIYEFLFDFTQYPRYADHLVEVMVDGDGGPGTRYALRFEWWKLDYTARSEVTAVDPPTRIDWQITRDLDASGCWVVEPLSELPADAPADTDAACRVWFEVAYDPQSVSAGTINLPAFVSLGWVIDKLRPIIREEAERVVDRIVADLEERRREVDVEIDQRARHL